MKIPYWREGTRVGEFTYKNIQILCGGSHAPRSDPPHKIMQCKFYYSTRLSHSFPADQNCQSEMICTS